MSTTGLLLALAAACVHAVWNLLLARTEETEAASAVALATGVLLYAPAALALWQVEPEAWGYLAGSGVLQLAYWSLLAAAYRRADLSVVYPVGRGLAPLLVLAVGASFLGEETSWLQGAGVCLVAAGVLLVRGLRLGAGAPGVLLGLAIAVCIAGYTLLDNEGIRHANAVTYVVLELLFPATGYGLTVLFLKGWPALRREIRPPILLAGAGVVSAYLLVLLALRVAPAASVSAVRETSVVIAVLLARVVLAEPVTRTRLGGAVLVAAGVAALAL